MSIFEAIILGLVQGLTEFIPISSSGHLVLTQQLFGRGSDHLFLEWINIGTALALIIYFWPKISGILIGIVKDRKYKLAVNILISIIPAGLLGFLLAGFIETNSFFGSPWTVTATLFLIGVVMVVVEKLPRASQVKSGQELSKSRSLTIGLAQATALIPGVSRSGSTIITGRLMGLNASAAAEYSFLIAIPVMLGVIAKLILKSSDRAYLFANLDTLLIGNVVALLSGLLAVGFLMRYLSKHTLVLFGWYRIILAVIVSVVLLLQ